MPNKFILLLAFLCASLSVLGQSAASYRVEFPADDRHKLTVNAVLPVDGKALEMEQSWPGDVPEVGDKGWPALVKNLRVTDEQGRAVEAVLKGPEGWTLKESHKGSLTLSYEVDYSVAAAANWPAPREAAFRDAEHFLVSGRSLFITSPASKFITVSFAVPRGWHEVAPWHFAGKKFSVASNEDLTSNLIVFTKAATDVISVGGFRLTVTAMGHWQTVRGEVAAVLRGVIPRYLKMFSAAKRTENYSVVLLPVLDHGGESYRASFAYTFESAPVKTNRDAWGHTIAHEIFHYWNGWRLRGADYASSQWFQEGFTDYFATLAMLQAGLITPDDFRHWINAQVARYKDLKTPLAKPGTRKGPPLYGGGALVALSWDIQIRHDSNGRRSLADAMRSLWRDTGNGARPYEGHDIKTALSATATYDWDGFYNKYIDGSERLPLSDVLPLAGLKLSETVELDARAGIAAQKVWDGFGNK